MLTGWSLSILLTGYAAQVGHGGTLGGQPTAGTSLGVNFFVLITELIKCLPEPVLSLNLLLRLVHSTTKARLK